MSHTSPPTDDYLLNLLIHRRVWNPQEKMADLQTAARLLHDHDSLLRRCYDALPNPEHEPDFEKRKMLHQLLQDLSKSIAWGVKCPHQLVLALCPHCPPPRIT